MIGSDTKSGTPSIGDPVRMLRAQVEIIAASLPVTMWLNPSWAIVSIIPFLGFFPFFGYVSPVNLIAAVSVHVVNATIAAFLYLWYRHNPTDIHKWAVRFNVFQVLIGISWGLLPWFLWVPDNNLNHVIVVVPIVAVMWTYAISRSTRFSLYLAGVLPIALLMTLRFLTADGRVAPAMVIIISITFSYTMLIAFGAKRLNDTMLRTRFANEDLTADLRSARDEALRKRNEAETANASKTKFLANMSHELRTPLNAILGFSEIIAAESFGPVGISRYRDYAQDINASGAHLLILINDILDIAKIESGKMTIRPELLDARTLIGNTLRTMDPRMREKNLKLSVHVSPDADAVWADARAFKQILINLVTNAVKFTQVGGAIAIYGRRMPEGGFELIVEDNGPGIDASLLDQVFLPFNQIEDRYNRHEGGSGLGLSLVRGLASLHRGKAWIESAGGAGVKAHVYFPEGNTPAVASYSERLTA